MDELADLFQARSRFVEALAEEEDPLARAREVLSSCPRSTGSRRSPTIRGSARRSSAVARPQSKRGCRPCVLAELAELNAAYEERFGFRFVVFVDCRPRPRSSRCSASGSSGRARTSSRPAATSSSRSRWTGGGAPEDRLRQQAVSVYRTDGVSSLFAAEVGMTARGEAFGPSYTEGDNTLVVATDSMKNFIQITALEYEGSLEASSSPRASLWTRTATSRGSSSRPARCRSPAAASSRSRASAATAQQAELALDRDGTLEHRSAARACG